MIKENLDTLNKVKFGDTIELINIMNSDKLTGIYDGLCIQYLGKKYKPIVEIKIYYCSNLLILDLSKFKIFILEK